MPQRFNAVNARKGRPSNGLPKCSKIEVKAFSLGLFLGTDARWNIGNVLPKNLSMFKVKNATTENYS
jgi:hypothetical protein